MNVYNVIILDESGSMSAIYNQALTGINEVLSGIRKNQEEYPDQQHYVTIVTFEGNGVSGIKTRRDRGAMGKIDDFTKKDYWKFRRKVTPLFRFQTDPLFRFKVTPRA